MNFRACSDCYENLPVRSFNRWIGKYGMSYRPECNKCRNEKLTRKKREALIIERPSEYWQCEDEACNWIQAIEKENCERCG